MLSNIVQNSDRLIKSQYHDEQSILNQLIKLKSKKRNYSYFQPAHKKGSIFQQPTFLQNITLNSFKQSSRNFTTSQTARFRFKSEEALKNQNKAKPLKPQRIKQNQTINSFQVSSIKTSKMIHSRKNNEWMISTKNPKIHHQRVFSRRDKFIKENQIIQQPGFANLCFYKNALEQIQNVRTARISNRKRNSPKKTQRDVSSRNKIKFNKYKANMNEYNPQCRPWSPKNDSQLNQSDFPYFKSLTIKV